MRYLIGVSAVRNFALGMTLLVTGKLFLAPAFTGGFADFLAICLFVSGALVAIGVIVNPPPSLPLGIGMLISDVVLVYFLANRVLEDVAGLFGLPILLAALVLQDFGIISLSFRKAPDALHRGRE